MKFGYGKRERIQFTSEAMKGERRGNGGSTTLLFLFSPLARPLKRGILGQGAKSNKETIANRVIVAAALGIED
ncbi:hypothetical protein N7445_008556 [Penicillium cf. griseofulvum]|nr:hypothetical protein N7445_008556 [Penicillium cf. griseofulvum]